MKISKKLNYSTQDLVHQSKEHSFIKHKTFSVDSQTSILSTEEVFCGYNKEILKMLNL